MSSAFHKVKSFSSRGKLGVGDPWIVDCVVDVMQDDNFFGFTFNLISVRTNRT